MKFENPFKLQNWKMRTFLIVILSIQLSLLGLFALNNLGVETPIIRTLIGFIYLSFIPGYLLLRILKLHNLSGIESFLYALGISLFMNMFVGFLMNVLYPIWGITDKPIAEIPIVLTMTAVVFLLCIIVYFRYKDYNNPDHIDLKDVLNPQVLSLSLIPFMAIFGTYLVNYYDTNILLMIMIVVIALVALIIMFTNWIDEKYYPYAIWVISIALLLHIMLITPYIIINDAIVEYYIARTVINNNYWALYDINPMHLASNTVLSVTILPAMISHIMNIDLMWVYKLILPMLYSSLPLIVYLLATYISRIFKWADIIIPKIAFIAALLLMANFDFIRIASITKQAIAMLFFGLLILLIVKGPKTLSTKVLILFFTGGLITSHYGLAFLFCAMLIFTYVTTIVWNVLFKIDNYQTSYNYAYTTIIFLTSTIAWYMYISQAVAFDQVVHILRFAAISFQEYLFDPYAARGLYMIGREMPSISMSITRNILLLTILFMFVGYLTWIFELLRAKNKELKEIILFGFVSFWITLLGASFFVAGLAAMDPRRLFAIAVIMLGIFGVIGGARLFTFILRNNIKANINLVGIIFLILMMFSTTGFIQELFDDSPSSIAISQESILQGNNPRPIIKLSMMTTNTIDIYSGRWFALHTPHEANIYRMDLVQSFPSLMIYSDIEQNRVNLALNVKHIEGKFEIVFTEPDTGEYIQLTHPNIYHGLFWAWYNPLQKLIILEDSEEVLNHLDNSSKIYDNGGSQILLSN